MNVIEEALRLKRNVNKLTKEINNVKEELPIKITNVKIEYSNKGRQKWRSTKHRTCYTTLIDFWLGIISTLEALTN